MPPTLHKLVLCHEVCLLISFIFISSVITVGATPQFFDDESLESLDEPLFGISEEFEPQDGNVLVPEKRRARLSYFRSPYRGYSRGRYAHYGYHGYRPRVYGGGHGQNDWWRKKAVVNRYEMPWERLRDYNCFRKYCKDDTNCCRRYSKCNKEAQVCYDCWYGYPCSSNKDCCQRFPYCNKVLNTCGR